jgi:hypothetical protein
MFHAGLVVDDYKRVIGREPRNYVTQDVVCHAVATWSFRAAHGEKVNVLGLFERCLDLVFHKPITCHAAGNILSDFPGIFANAAYAPGILDPQYFVQVRVGIPIYGEKRVLTSFYQGFYNQCSYRSLADSALPCNCERCSHR